MVTNLRGRSYEDRLKGVGMTTLQDSRERGDMMTSFRVMEGQDRTRASGSRLLRRAERQGSGPGRTTRQGS